MSTTPEENKKLADLLFPEVKKTPQDYLNQYPERSLSEGVQITRFGPSPTGFLHIGGLFTALVSARIAHQSGGTFFLRIEDTDKKREVEGGAEKLYGALTDFGIRIDEGYGTEEEGEYGPYKQSLREEIYQTFVKDLITKGLAYPCFCTQEELEEVRNKQQECKALPGYYGSWAKYRDQSFEEIEKNLSEGKDFVVRFRSEGSPENSFKFKDKIKGEVSVTENSNDIVLIKADGLPTYHLAHIVDDFLMRTTLVIRGDEWLSSLPVHLQLFRALELKAPKYAHVAPILKSEDGNKRKLSKRKDPEASVDYYAEKGYPKQAITEYLLNIANSSFEDWRKGNPTLPNTDFTLELNKMSKSGALFNIDKLDDISKEIISRMTSDDVYARLLTWSETFNPEFFTLLTDNKDFCHNIIGIERNGNKPRKDIAYWEEAPDHFMYFFDDHFEKVSLAEGKVCFDTLEATDAPAILKLYAQSYDKTISQEDWFPALKEFAEANGYASNMKEHKVNPDQYKGNVGDIAMILRAALTGRTRTPDLYQMMQVLGKERVVARLTKVAEMIA